MTLGNTIGCSFVGVVAAAALYGVSCVQTWFYFNRYGTTDIWYIKALVLICLGFDTIHQALISHTVYWYCVTNFNNPDALSMLVWSILLEVLFNGLIGLIVQSFLIMRVWRLSNRNLVLTIFAGSLVLAEFGCSVVFTVQSMKLKTWKDLEQLKPLSMTVNVLGAMSDFVIALALVFYLRRSRTGFRKSDMMISKLIVFSVSTGLLTTLCAIASLVSIVLWGDTLIYVAFYFSLGRLYFNSVLATLNARKDLLADDPDDITFSLQTISKVVPRKLSSPQQQRTISIKIQTTREVDGGGKHSERSCHSAQEVDS
ncbi:hypothetical protein MIND_00726500 [Mycena indigotica]|uniref:DUF6534 domain-containing protein n=1 Tax=Mycena indigotica TaxID=2126181 RepID=A0A8H6SKV9_9AGAR|nr:uncharacterized protein MIND_00726500 [Mycena indigotica]KAF7301610.1 hypothetical protein MIND_00726500 [Mycena indigotica]